jgi:hypothetical protein
VSFDFAKRPLQYSVLGLQFERLRCRYAKTILLGHVLEADQPLRTPRRFLPNAAKAQINSSIPPAPIDYYCYIHFVPPLHWLLCCICCNLLNYTRQRFFLFSCARALTANRQSLVQRPCHHRSRDPLSPLSLQNDHCIANFKRVEPLCAEQPQHPLHSLPFLESPLGMQNLSQTH